MIMPPGRYKDLLKSFGFQSFLLTQFLGAFNDNAYKIVLSLLIVDMAIGGGGGGRYLSIVSAVFILPWLIFSGYAGWFSDIFNKRSVLIVTKALEIVAMVLGLFAFLSGRIELMLATLFLMALQSTFFSPAKYGILPEIFTDKDLSQANGLLEMMTFLAIILGTTFGGLLFDLWKEGLERISLVLIAIAITGTITSFGITRVPPSGAEKPFRWNPWGEIASGIGRLYSERPLCLTVIGISYFWFLGALMQMGIILLGKEVMDLSESRIGLLVAFLAIGIGMGSIAAGWLSRGKVELGLVPSGSIGIGLSAILLYLSSPSYIPSAITLILLGFSGGLFIVPLNAFLQQRSGKDEKGRLIATNNFFNYTGILLASGVLWLLRDAVDIQADGIILLSGLFTIGATIYTLRIWPELSFRFKIL